MNFPFDRQRIGDMADVLDMKFRFDARPEFQGQKEESVRELYNWLREQDRKWGENPKQAESLGDDEEDTIIFTEQTSPAQPTDAQSPGACPAGGDPPA